MKIIDRIAGSRYRYRAQYLLQRYARAYAYARDRLTEDQARDIMFEIETDLDEACVAAQEALARPKRP